MIAGLIGRAWRWLTGGGIEGLARTYARLKDSDVEVERIRADVAKAEIEARIAALRASAEIRLATAGFAEMRVLTFVIAAPFAVHAATVGLDTIFGFGWGIAAYPPPFDEWEGAILLSFFGIYGLSRGAAALGAAIGGRPRPPPGN